MSLESETWHAPNRAGIQAVTGADLDEEVVTYRLSAFKIHQATTATSTHGTSALKTSNTSRNTRAETTVRLVSAFASSVIRCQRGTRGIRDRTGDPQHNLEESRYQTTTLCKHVF